MGTNWHTARRREPAFDPTVHPYDGIDHADDCLKIDRLVHSIVLVQLWHNDNLNCWPVPVLLLLFVCLWPAIIVLANSISPLLIIDYRAKHGKRKCASLPPVSNATSNLGYLSFDRKKKWISECEACTLSITSFTSFTFVAISLVFLRNRKFKCVYEPMSPTSCYWSI